MITDAAAIAQVCLTQFGKAGERIGLDRKFKATTTTNRTHSLFNQGALCFAGVCAKWQRDLRQTFENFRENVIYERFTCTTI